MIDIHAHILPGVDDGASDMEESTKILEKGRSEGIKTFVLIPHIRDDSDWNKIDYIVTINGNRKYALIELPYIDHWTPDLLDKRWMQLTVPDHVVFFLPENVDQTAGGNRY